MQQVWSIIVLVWQVLRPKTKLDCDRQTVWSKLYQTTNIVFHCSEACLVYPVARIHWRIQREQLLCALCESGFLCLSLQGGLL